MGTGGVSNKSGKGHGMLLLVLLVYVLPLLVGLSGCFGNDVARSGSPTVERDDATSGTTRSDDETDDFGLGHTPVYRVEPEPLDPRWPTTDAELLAIPEEDRWYNAGAHVGSYGTIAGPVSSVYQATNSPGMPVFVNIGNAYPNGDRAQVVIWGERVPEFERMLDAIDDGGAWVSVSGYIGSYEGVPQIDVNDSATEWTWWIPR